MTAGVVEKGQSASYQRRNPIVREVGDSDTAPVWHGNVHEENFLGEGQRTLPQVYYFFNKSRVRYQRKGVLSGLISHPLEIRFFSPQYLMLAEYPLTKWVLCEKRSSSLMVKYKISTLGSAVQFCVGVLNKSIKSQSRETVISSGSYPEG